jgi:hypothetical protein
VDSRVTLADVIAAHRRWLHLPDPGSLEFVLAVVAANRRDAEGEPTWGLVIGPSSGGKTAQLAAIAELKGVHPAATLTEAALLSGTVKKDREQGARGGLLREMSAFGILCCKDFGSVLSMNREQRAALLAALREIYDGAWTRHVGAGGGVRLHWAGKVGFIGGATGAIDQHHAVMAALGERFVMYRITVEDAEAQAARSLLHQGHEREMRAELGTVVRALFDALDLDHENDLSDADRTRLVAVADLVSCARSPVIRDPMRREIELVPEREAPARLAGALARLLTGLRMIGTDDVEAWRVTVKTGLDSMPVARRRAFEYLADSSTQRTTTEVAVLLGLPNPTTHRVLQDLAAHDVIQRFPQGEGKADVWEARTWACERYAAATASEKSEALYRTTDYTYDDISEEVGASPNGRAALDAPDEPTRARARGIGG